MRVTGLVLDNGQVINLEGIENNDLDNVCVGKKSITISLVQKIDHVREYKCIEKLHCSDQNKIKGLCSASEKAALKNGSMKNGKLRYHECIAILEKTKLQLKSKLIKIEQFGCKIYYICEKETLIVDRITYDKDQIDIGVASDKEIVRCKDAVILLDKKIIKVAKGLNALTYILDANGHHCKLLKLDLLSDNMRSKNTGKIIASRCGLCGNIFALSVQDKYLYIVEFTGDAYKSGYVGKVTENIKYAIIKKSHGEYLLDTNSKVFRLEETRVK